MSRRRDLKSSCHGYLPGGLTIFLVKKRLKNKIWQYDFEGPISNVDFGHF